MGDGSNPWDEADERFKRLRDEKTATTAKKIDAARVKEDASKSARLKAARLARDTTAKASET